MPLLVRRNPITLSDEGLILVGLVAAIGIGAYVMRKAVPGATTTTTSTSNDPPAASSLYLGTTAYSLKAGASLVLVVVGTLQTVSTSNSAVANAAPTGGQIAGASSVTITGVAPGTSTITVEFTDAGGNDQTSTVNITVTS